LGGNRRQEFAMTKDGNPKFQIPTEMQAFAEKSMEQAKVAFDSFIAATRQAVTSAETQAASARTGAKETGDLAMRVAERNMTASFDFAQRLMRAKDPQELAALHTEYVKSQVAALTEQAKELSKQAAKMAGQGAH
jgi:phasin